MARADHDPAQAEAEIQRLQAEASVADDAKDDAQALVDRLERDMDSAFEVGDEAEVSRLQDRHQQAERDLEAAEQDFESIMDQIGNASTFWYEEDDDDDDEQ